MAIIDPSPTPDELKALAGVFQSIEAALETYLESPAGQGDANFGALTAAAISLNNAADAIAVMQLNLAADQGEQAVAAINQATAELQKAIVVRNEITHDLDIVKSVVSFGASIASGNVQGIIGTGSALFNVLTAGNGS